MRSGPEIVTDRLVLRPFRAEDLAAFVAYRRDPAVARYQSWDETYSVTEAEQFLRAQQRDTFGARGAWLQLAATDRSDGTLAGDCALHFVEDQPATVELGVTFSPACQGRGLAGEALGAVVAMLFREHAVHRIFAETDDRNLAAHRLFERLGFRCEARLVDADWFKGEWTTLRVHAILREEWDPERSMAG